MKTNRHLLRISICLACSLACVSGASRLEALAQSTGEHYDTKTALVLSRVDAALVKEFERAWRSSGGGVKGTERAILIFLMKDGRLRGEPLENTNEHRQVSIRWKFPALAMVHTHPIDDSPEPSPADCEIARMFGVPVFTLTQSGMYVYDPTTGKVSRVRKGLEWADPSKWAKTTIELVKK